MIDIHSHVLFGMDDGSEDMSESVEMCLMAYENNITDIIATPHMHPQRDFDSFIEQRDNRIALLNEGMRQEGIELTIHPGCEFFMDEDIFYYEHLERLTLNNSGYLLVEFDFHTPSFTAVGRYLEVVLAAGLTPVVAHVERYELFQKRPSEIRTVLGMGCLLQVNASSLCGQGGRKDRHLGLELVNSGVAHFISTDAHSSRYRTPELLTMLMESRLTLTREAMHQITVENPRSILENAPPSFFHSWKPNW